MVLINTKTVNVLMGFDIAPPIDKTSEQEKLFWTYFLQKAKEEYADSEFVHFRDNYIEFDFGIQGEPPRLPIEGHKFLRFFAEVLDLAVDRLDRCVYTLHGLAAALFGLDRVVLWYGGENGSYGTPVYSWDVVYESIKSYEQPDEPEASSATNPTDSGDVEMVHETELVSKEVTTPTGSKIIEMEHETELVSNEVEPVQAGGVKGSKGGRGCRGGRKGSRASWWS